MTWFRRKISKACPVPEEEEMRRCETEEHDQGVDFLKFFLAPCVCFWAFGFPENSGWVSTMSAFAIPSFFILSGYYVLGDDKAVRREKLIRAIRRSSVLFLLMFVGYFIINVFYMNYMKMDWLPGLLNLRLPFDFFVLNMWPFPIGDNIWFIQAYFYACVMLFLMNQWGWLKYYKLILILSAVFMVLAGELAGVIGFNVLGYGFIPGGAVTRALPYLLLGMLLREKTARVREIQPWVYILIFAVGIGMVYEEILLLAWLDKLVYYGHMLGYGVMAAAACGCAISRPQMTRTFFSVHGPNYAKCSYILANPIICVLSVLVSRIFPRYLAALLFFAGPVACCLCLLLYMLGSAVKRWGLRR